MKIFRRKKSASSIYTYDDASDVLRNKLNIKDFDLLEKVEREITSNRESEILTNPEYIGHDSDFSLEHLQSLHKYLFQDLYDWAGELRVTNIRKSGGDLFCSKDNIRQKFGILQRDLEFRNYFKEIESNQIYTKALARYYADLNYIHPFREGNGRTSRLFMSQLCELSGRHLDFSRCTKEEWNEASIQSHSGDISELQDIFSKIIVNPVSQRGYEFDFTNQQDDEIMYEDF